MDAPDAHDEKNPSPPFVDRGVTGVTDEPTAKLVKSCKNDILMVCAEAVSVYNKDQLCIFNKNQ